jgi:hypothetical protein
MPIERAEEFKQKKTNKDELNNDKLETETKTKKVLNANG